MAKITCTHTHTHPAHMHIRKESSIVTDRQTHTHHGRTYTLRDTYMHTQNRKTTHSPTDQLKHTHTHTQTHPKLYLAEFQKKNAFNTFLYPLSTHVLVSIYILLLCLFLQFLMWSVISSVLWTCSMQSTQLY